MIKHISSTFAHKFLIVLANFLIVVITSRDLGSVGRGETSLFMTDFSLLFLSAGIVSASAMAYFSTKKDLLTLSTISYAWTIIVSLLGFLIMNIIHPSPYTCLLIGSVLLQSFSSTHQMILLGRNNLFAYNLSSVVQPVLNLGYVYFQFHYLGAKSASVFVEGFFYTSCISYLFSVAQTYRLYYRRQQDHFKETATEMIEYGFGTQLSTILQTINYRVGLYILFWYGLSSAVGKLSNGLAIAEATWMITNSLSLVLYAYVLNHPIESEQKELTLQMAKLCFLLTITALGFLSVLPTPVYIYVFGQDFNDLKSYILILLPGVSLMAVGTLLAHYFSAKGNYAINNFKSIIGLTTIFILLLLFIPLLGDKGAAIASSASYAASSLYIMHQYTKRTSTPWSNFFTLKGLSIIWKNVKPKV